MYSTVTVSSFSSVAIKTYVFLSIWEVMVFGGMLGMLPYGTVTAVTAVTTHSTTHSQGNSSAYIVL